MVKTRKKDGKSGKEKIDGLSSKDLQRIHRAVGQCWQWSHSWRLAKARGVGKDGFPRCEGSSHKGSRRVPKVSIDHIKPVGEVGGVDYIKKMFIPSKGLQNLCQVCHKKKTKQERKLLVKVNKKAKNFTDIY